MVLALFVKASVTRRATGASDLAFIRKESHIAFNLVYIWLRAVIPSWAFLAHTVASERVGPESALLDILIPLG